MSKRSERQVRRKKADKHSKHKLLAIPLLLSVLVYVLCTNFEDRDALAPEAISQVSAPATTQSKLANTPAIGSAKHAGGWPATDLTFLSGPDPLENYLASNVPLGQLLAAPAVNGQARDAERITQVHQEFQQQASYYVFESANSRYAMISNRIVSEGDTLTEGVQLEKIDKGQLTISASSRVH